MNFELWLFTMKRLGQTMDAAKMIFDNLSEEDQERIRRGYGKNTRSIARQISKDHYNYAN